MDRLDTLKINSFLEDTVFSKKIRVYSCLTSTNNSARDLYNKEKGEAVVVLAEEQTAGRGRMDRQWLSPAGKNLLLSILLRPDIDIERIYTLTLALAVAVTEAVKKMTGLSSMIKWPNDIYLKGKKTGGILTEFRIRGSFPEYVILGLGLNVNWSPEKEILFPSTCIMKESGKEISRNELAGNILLKFDRLYKNIINGNVEGFHKRCNELSLVTGKSVSINSEGATVRGKALGIDSDGALLVREKNGEIKKVLNGDVSLRT